MPHRAARFVAGADDPVRFPALALPEIAIVGRSNVGKSSLLNRLVGQRGLARVSKTPGRTQQINFFVVGETLTLADLPGYGFAKVPLDVQRAWKGVVEAYFGGRPQLRAVCVLIDVRRGLGDDDQQLLAYLDGVGLAWFVVATKVDKLARGVWLERCRRLSADLGGGAVVPTSAASGEGIAQLWSALDAAARAKPRPGAVAAPPDTRSERART